mgnify:CR=1 FL=1
MTTAQAQAQHTFLQKVALQANLTNLYEAKEMSEIVFRVMRDMMDASLIDAISADLNASAHVGKNKILTVPISQLWNDSNPIVGWLSRIRSPFGHEAPGGIDDTWFLRRVRLEGGIPKTSTAPETVKAVFAATKAELSEANIQAVESRLPGRIRLFWKQA